MITSSQNSKLKWIRSLLSDRKTRLSEGAFVVEGVRLVEEALRAGWNPRLICYSETISARGAQIVESFTSCSAEVEEVSDRILEAVSDTQTPQGLIAVFPIPDAESPAQPDFILILDELRDPGNLGSILRSATAAGVQACFLTPGTADVFAPKVVRAAMGAHFHLPLFNWSWDQISPFCEQRGLKIFLADKTGGSPYWKVDLKKPVGLVIGGEAEGAGARARQVAHCVITIPMPGSSESLNAAVAAGVILFEVVRQRI